MRRRQSFPLEQGETCRCLHCGQRATIPPDTERMIWVCACGASGYYDDGDKVYPKSKFRRPNGEIANG